MKLEEVRKGIGEPQWPVHWGINWNKQEMSRSQGTSAEDGNNLVVRAMNITEYLSLVASEDSTSRL